MAICRQAIDSCFLLLSCCCILTIPVFPMHGELSGTDGPRPELYRFRGLPVRLWVEG